MAYKYLDRLEIPGELSRMDYRELELLCKDVRSFLIENVSKTGGHLSSNLGVVELTVALHHALNSPHDQILFDVGHQCYTHKLLTGRREGFDKLRQSGGISGFPSPAESPHDALVAGHGSASISAAIGLARAKKLQNKPGLVVVIIGDGAFTGGMVYEAINNIDHLDNLVIILNDNTMSISKNVGALAHYLTNLRTSPQYYKAKKDVKQVLDHTPVIGGGVIRGIQSMKSALRKSLFHSTFFEEMGLRYIGPADGHDLPALCTLFSGLREVHKPLLIHLETVKGKGFTPAEKNPGAYHGVNAFDVKNLQDPDVAPSDSFSTVFGKELVQQADVNNKICAITAAMKYGTGLQYMKKKYRDRFFDVGMAEAHAVTFAAGLAAGGMKPVVAIYSTFLQRAYDQIIHDVMIARQNVLFAIDRAGLVPADGETHQGIYDVAFLSQQPDLPVISPSNYAELTYWLGELLKKQDGPAVIRYARGKEPASLAANKATGKAYNQLVAHQQPSAVIVTYGVETAQALEAATMAEQQQMPVDVLQMVQINPLPDGIIDDLMKYPLILFAEEGVAQGGIGEHLALKLSKAGYNGIFIHQAIQQNRIKQADHSQLLKQTGLDAASLAGRLYEERK